MTDLHQNHALIAAEFSCPCMAHQNSPHINPLMSRKVPAPSHRDSLEKPPPKRVVLAQPLPRNLTLFLMLTQEISHQFGSTRLVWSARPPEVVAVHHSVSSAGNQRTSGLNMLCGDFGKSGCIAIINLPRSGKTLAHPGENNISDPTCYFIRLFGFFL